MVNNSIFYLVDTFKLMWIMNILGKKMERKKNIKWKKINNILLLIFLLFLFYFFLLIEVKIKFSIY